MEKMVIKGWTVVRENAFLSAKGKALFAKPKNVAKFSTRPHIVYTKQEADDWANRFNQYLENISKQFPGFGYLTYKVIVKEIEVCLS